LYIYTIETNKQQEIMTITDNTGRELTKKETVNVLKEENKINALDYTKESTLQFNLQVIRKIETELEIERLDKVQGNVRSDREFNMLEKKIQELKAVLRQLR
tara:strand:- start:53 stop:358 length:306 start_codon:yes stop_codon:yes gene_type:complete